VRRQRGQATALWPVAWPKEFKRGYIIMAGMRAKLEICGFCREKNVFFSKKIPNDDQYLSTASHRTRLEKHF